MADEARLLTEAVQDYWRQQVYPLQGEGLDRVLAIWSGVDALAEDMKALLAEGYDASRIAMAGDSAGGNLTLMTTIAAMKQGLPAPAAMVMMSPAFMRIL